MKISTKGVYALEAMIELASRNDTYISIRDIAEARNCSIKYLEQIFMQLKKAQLLVSTRGKAGGYQLAKDPNDITAKDIILAVEEKLDPVVCLSHSYTCSRAHICRTQSVWLGMQNEIFHVLENKSLQFLKEAYIREVQA